MATTMIDTRTLQATARIERLREAKFAREARDGQRNPRANPHVLIAAARSWQETTGETWHIIRRARRIAAILDALPVEIAPDELLVGRLPLGETDAHMEAALQEARAFLATQPPHKGQSAHMTLDNELILRRGLAGIAADIRARVAALDLADPDDQAKERFYAACLMALEAVGRLAQRYAAHAADLVAAEADPQRRAELAQIAAICAQVPMHPARTFWEALQAVHFMTYAVQAGEELLLFPAGRMDRYLWPYYERDIAVGALTPAGALELIDCFYILMNELVPRSLAVGVMIGGHDATGREVTNEMSYLLLEAVAHVRMAYPGVSICYRDDTPEALVQRGCELLADGLTHPAIFNDAVITRGLIELGVTPPEACEYIHSTCVEITPIAASNVWVASPYFNLVQMLHDLIGVPPLNAGPAWTPVPPATSLATFDGLLESYRAHLGTRIMEAVRVQNAMRRHRMRHGGHPLLSCFVRDCLQRGVDIDEGGARYSWIECSFVGLANLVDSLAAIRQFVYAERRWTLAELAALLREDFAGDPAARELLLHRADKYGNGIAAVDELAVHVIEWIVDECARYRVVPDGRFVPGLFCWVMHERLGRETAASADGRVAGFPLADGAGPAQGRERQGPTGAVLSTTVWDHTPMMGGLVLNLKFSRTHGDAKQVASFRDLLRVYMARGGLEMQINCVDSETLRDAQARPELYRDLVVRVAGYSDYFTTLSRGMQDEIIARTEFRN